MNILPFRHARALFRAACGLPPRAVSNLGAVPSFRQEPPRERLFRGIMEATPSTLQDDAMEFHAATVPPAVDRPAPKVAGFLRLKVDRQKKATGSFLLFSEGRVLTGTVEGAASDALGHHVETSFRLPAGTARKLVAGQTVPVSVKCLQFQACEH